MTGSKRVVVIDGLNIARDRGFSTWPAGSAKAIVIAVEHLLKSSCDVHVILPTWAFSGRQRKSDSMLLEAPLLEPYLQTIVHLAPSGMDEDGFILRFALERSGYVLSNDLFRNHIRSGFVSRDWVQAHRIGFMFIHDQLLIDMQFDVVTKPLKSPVDSQRDELVKIMPPLSRVVSAPARVGDGVAPMRVKSVTGDGVRGCIRKPPRRGTSGPSMRELLSRASTRERF